MSDLEKWHRRAVCPGCGWHTEATSLGGVPFLTCCPECGERYSWTSRGRASWSTRSMRWVRPERRLFRPSTWGLEGHWETRA
jgi:hypothetical protein